MAVWIGELAVKLFGYGVRGYFRDPFNCYDFVLVALSVVQLAVLTAAPSVFAIFRVTRGVQEASDVFRFFYFGGLNLGKIDSGSFLGTE